MDVRGKKITVVGMGVSGIAAAKLLKRKGAEVYLTESSDSAATKEKADELRGTGISVETGAHTEKFMRGCELVVVSPGVMDSSEALKIAAKSCMPVIGEIELASLFCKGPIVAITGTNGKTTTTTLIGLLLESADKNPVVCGNIGEAFSDKVDTISQNHIAVVEVSSFQLKRIGSFRPKVAVITNITQNHFDWHIDFKEYLDCKKNIYKNQRVEDYTVLNYDDHLLRALEYETRSNAYFFSQHNKVKGAYFDGRDLILDTEGKKDKICSVNEIRLKGSHNISNILCACICAHIFGVSIQAMRKVILDFSGLAHRFQYIDNIDGVTFIDDSKATTVDAARAALLSCKEKVILIAGGRDKGSDFSTISRLIGERTRAVVLIGEAKEKIRKALECNADIYDAQDMDKAVSISQAIAEKGDIVLLSPMCASFDMYKDYKHRGEVFKEAVGKLERKSISV